LDCYEEVRKSFALTGKSNSHEIRFIHADEAETSVAILMFLEGTAKMNPAHPEIFFFEPPLLPQQKGYDTGYSLF